MTNIKQIKIIRILFIAILYVIATPVTYIISVAPEEIFRSFLHNESWVMILSLAIFAIILYFIYKIGNINLHKFYAPGGLLFPFIVNKENNGREMDPKGIQGLIVIGCAVLIGAFFLTGIYSELLAPFTKPEELQSWKYLISLIIAIFTSYKVQSQYYDSQAGV